MTDSPVTKTAEQIVAEALDEVWNFKTFSEAEEAGKVATDALREAGLLVSGAPSEEQIEMAWGVLNAYGLAAHIRTSGKREREVVGEMLTAAGVGSPAPVQVDEDVVDTIEGLQNLGYGSIIQEGDEAPKILRYSEFGERWWENPMHRSSAVGDKWISLPARVLYQRGGVQ